MNLDLADICGIPRIGIAADLQVFGSEFMSIGATDPLIRIGGTCGVGPALSSRPATSTAAIRSLIISVALPTGANPFLEILRKRACAKQAAQGLANIYIGTYSILH